MIEDLQAHYRDQPGEVTIETLAVCNARCTFCPYSTLGRAGTKMPDELLHRLIDEMAAFEKVFYFSPFKLSDPFLDKRMIPLLRTFNEKVPHGLIRLFTNGSALTDANVEGVAGLKQVAHLWISLNTHRSMEYERLMGLDFERTAGNLDRLHKRDFPHEVVISRVGSDPDFVKYVQWRWPGFRPAIIKRDAWIDFTDAEYPEIPDAPCARWWELNIAATGQASLCCMDAEAQYGFGDVNTQTLLEIYNHPTLRAWREGVSRRTVGKPCEGCSY